MALVSRLDVLHCEQLARSAVDGDARAANQLVEYLWPFWLNRVRGHKRMRALSTSEDHVHNVVSRLVQKLLDPSVIANYGRWREATSGANFAQWLYTVTDNETQDYIRHIAGRASSSSEDDGPSAKLLLNEFATSPLLEDLGIRPPNTELQTAQELLTFAQRMLPADQLNAVTLWLQGATDEEIAAHLSLDEVKARGLRRAGVARLRREFAPDGGARDDG